LFLFGCNGRKFFSFLFIFAVWSASRICCWWDSVAIEV
jgi:hypothetical protein